MFVAWQHPWVIYEIRQRCLLSHGKVKHFIIHNVTDELTSLPNRTKMNFGPSIVLHQRPPRQVTSDKSSQAIRSNQFRQSTLNQTPNYKHFWYSISWRCTYNGHSCLSRMTITAFKKYLLFMLSAIGATNWQNCINRCSKPNMAKEKTFSNTLRMDSLRCLCNPRQLIVMEIYNNIRQNIAQTESVSRQVVFNQSFISADQTTIALRSRVP